jgi:hypothetical protein
MKTVKNIRYLELPLLIIILVLAFTMYANRHSYCDASYQDGISISTWLLVVGIAMLVPFGLILLILVVMIISPIFALILIGILSVLTPIFWVCLMIVGGLILFSEPGFSCIKSGDVMAINALVIWCLLIILIVMQVIFSLRYEFFIPKTKGIVN